MPMRDMGMTPDHLAAKESEPERIPWVGERRGPPGRVQADESAVGVEADGTVVSR